MDEKAKTRIQDEFTAFLKTIPEETQGQTLQVVDGKIFAIQVYPAGDEQSSLVELPQQQQ